MPLSAFGLIVLAGLIHASWNIAAKKADGDARFAFQSSAFMALVWAPVGLWLGWSELPRWGMREWGFVAASGVLHVVYYIVLLRGYRRSDLTVVYPLARGSGPLLSSLVAVVFLGERLTWVGLAGTMTTVAALAQGMTTYDPVAIHLLRVGSDRLLQVCDGLIGMTRAQRAALGPMHEGRVDVIAGGAIVIEELAFALHDRAGIDALTVSEHDILDGIALSIAH